MHADGATPKFNTPNHFVMFPTTSWSQIISLKDLEEPSTEQALNDLCRVYWHPLNAFVQRSGYSPHDADDLTQEFLARFVDKEYYQRADQSRGKFRSFLLHSLKNFLSTKRSSRNSIKRGGQVEHLSLDDPDHKPHESEMADSAPETPEEVYQREWAFTVLSQSLSRLKKEYGEGQNAALFSEMKDYLWGKTGDAPLREKALSLNISENALRTSTHRMRRRFGTILRDVVSETLSDDESIDDEIRVLMKSIAQSNRV